ncbi:tetratricopeptide repeat protein [Massilia sp. TSP1-1-2]|uniref:tetratricopeptide repeat protein n=1 Tax=Massilia sp. TSP1-1-2 TaxID=2804649 RepID=UPI003CEA22F0
MTTLTTLYRFLGSAALIASLTACATNTATPSAAAAPKLQDMLTKASEAASAGQKEQAITQWKATAAAYPTDKTAWGHIAKAKFDAAQYGEAIVNAEEVLVRDPNDKQASSIIATSGLRLATRALSNLSRQNGFTGSLQKESMELARVLRDSLGNDILFSPPPDKITIKDPKPKAKVVSDAPAKVKLAEPPKVKEKPKADDCKAGDPFCALK